MNGSLVETVDENEADHTDKWAVPEEIGGELTPAPVVGPNPRRAPNRHMSRTLASPIPAMLAETMGLAQDNDAPARPPAAPSRK